MMGPNLDRAFTSPSISGQRSTLRIECGIVLALVVVLERCMRLMAAASGATAGRRDSEELVSP